MTKNILRITLGGDALKDFPDGQESAYIKLLFPQGSDERPLMRTYTIRQQRSNKIDVDFVMHEEHGPARPPPGPVQRSQETLYWWSAPAPGS